MVTLSRAGEPPDVALEGPSAGVKVMREDSVTGENKRSVLVLVKIMDVPKDRVGPGLDILLEVNAVLATSVGAAPDTRERTVFLSVGDLVSWR